MISLKRNSKGELVNAPGKRTRKNSIYQPNQNLDFKISRGKFQDFITCKKCFYLDRVSGLKTPDTPPYSLNSATDMLYKKEFDDCRIKRQPHRLLKKYDLEHIIPFEHQDSSMIHQFSLADCLIIRDPFEKENKNGDEVKIIKFPNNV